MESVANKKRRLKTIAERIHFQQHHPVWRSQYKAFIDGIAGLPLKPDARALSFSCGDGMWDFLAFSHQQQIKTIIATDIVDCPVKTKDRALLNRPPRTWTFQKIQGDTALPFDDNTFDLVFHQDVIEHATAPYFLLNENHRVLKPGGYLLFGSPNLFRPANIARLMMGKLFFPCRLTTVSELGPVVHVQEFNEYQLRNMISEAGFRIMRVTQCFWGIGFVNLSFSDFPTHRFGKNLCQYLFFAVQKPSP